MLRPCPEVACIMIIIQKLLTTTLPHMYYMYILCLIVGYSNLFFFQSVLVMKDLSPIKSATKGNAIPHRALNFQFFCFLYLCCSGGG
mmetsp:Transcript_14355/g.21838  ORF Transcript_14355/g.21838 Transcript_14355/m.21838 type:complete len:87 (+) Transcript_14355:473-733(+)